ncbi:MAG: carbon-nitrogen hydrolase family protein [Clostridia bacterium]|nr:carbon-nitrogen hydrolase family protein [Clostridia bacterium]MBR1686326.1 carbon-nitrogen hydrolase family protein [Clostridia bacterium]MBR2288123.1 carbon-nitrogen hydrolase family protein [Clostridia bacterium]
MRLALLQLKQNGLYDFASPDLSLTDSMRRSLAREMCDQTLALMEDLGPTDLVVTTEAVNFPGTKEAEKLTESLPWENAFSAYARSHATYVAACLYLREEGGIRNCLLLYDRTGREIARYRKIHLAGDERVYLKAGDRFVYADTDMGRIGLSICWDMQFPETARHYALEDCRLVICPTWGWESTYAQARAYENGIYVASAMSVPYAGDISGIRMPSQVISPDGSVLAQGSFTQSEAVVCDIDLGEESPEHALRMRDRRSDVYGRLVQ